MISIGAQLLVHSWPTRETVIFHEELLSVLLYYSYVIMHKELVLSTCSSQWQQDGRWRPQQSNCTPFRKVQRSRTHILNHGFGICVTDD